jgi:uncharacterized protein YuzE
MGVEVQDGPCNGAGAVPVITYDRNADAAYIYLTPSMAVGEASHQVMVDEVPGDSEIVLDFNDEGRILGIEIIGARSCLADVVLKSAVPIT